MTALELSEVLTLAKERTARDGEPRFVCWHAGSHELRFRQPTDRHCFRVTTEEVRFLNAERATLVPA